MRVPDHGVRLALPASLALAALATLGATSARSAAAPVNTVLPTVVGSAAQSATLTASNGTWTGDGLAFALQWTRCNTAGLSCSDIASATGQTYLVTDDDVGKTLRVRVSATSSAGQASAVSAATAVIVSSSGPVPVNTSLPVVAGAPALGGTVTTGNGTWTGTPAPTFTYAWLQCNAQGSSCTTIPGETSAVYHVHAGDAGGTLRSVVTATNSEGHASAQSDATTPVGLGGGPQATTPASIVGTAQVGATLTILSGSWSGTGSIRYGYEWDRCNAQGSSCSPIAGADNRTYAVTAADGGSRLRASVTATDDDGSTVESAGLTAVVGGTGAPSGPAATSGAPGVPGAPSLVDQPEISGLLQVGATLRTSDGSWTSAPGLQLVDSWLRCDAHGNVCAPIARARGAAYRLTRADAGRTIRSQVTALNATGSSSARSDATVAIGKWVAIRLRGGRYSVPARGIAPPERLVVTSVHLRRTGPAAKPLLTARVAVRDLRRDSVRDAVVSLSARGLHAAAARTGRGGVAVVRLRTARPLPRRTTIVVTVRARAGKGLTTLRLVRLRLR